MYSFLHRQSKVKYAQFVEKTRGNITNSKPICIWDLRQSFSQKTVYKIIRKRANILAFATLRIRTKGRNGYNKFFRVATTLSTSSLVLYLQKENRIASVFEVASLINALTTCDP